MLPFISLSDRRVAASESIICRCSLDDLAQLRRGRRVGDGSRPSSTTWPCTCCTSARVPQPSPPRHQRGTLRRDSSHCGETRLAPPAVTWNWSFRFWAQAASSTPGTERSLRAVRHHLDARGVDALADEIAASPRPRGGCPARGCTRSEPRSSQLPAIGSARSGSPRGSPALRSRFAWSSGGCPTCRSRSGSSSSGPRSVPWRARRPSRAIRCAHHSRSALASRARAPAAGRRAGSGLRRRLFGRLLATAGSGQREGTDGDQRGSASS